MPTSRFKVVAPYLLLFVITLSLVWSTNITYFAAAQQVSEQILTITPVADTFVSSGRPSERNGGFELLAVGYEPTGNRQILRSLLQFDLTAIPPGSQIISATLFLHLSGVTGPNPIMNVTVQRTLTAWQESLNWQEHLNLQLDDKLVAQSITNQPNWNQWSITLLVQDWLTDQRPVTSIGLLLKGDESPSQHQRAFWSKDCKQTTCFDKKPYLRIAYQESSPTPAPTNTPTPTPTPPPGVVALHMRNEPSGLLLPGERLTYTIAYRTPFWATGDFTLTNVVITNPIPAQLAVIPNSLRSSRPAQMSSSCGAGGQVSWTLQTPLHNGESGEVAYAAWRPLPPVAAGQGLTITNQAPPTAGVGQLFSYQLAVTNQSEQLAQSLVITNRLPLNTSYVFSTDGGVLKDDCLVYWEKPELKAGERLTVTLVVRANQSVINQDYGVRAAAGLFAQNNKPVVTQVGGTLVLPLPTEIIITNPGALITWNYRPPNDNLQVGSLVSGATYNPLNTLYLANISKVQTTGGSE